MCGMDESMQRVLKGVDKCVGRGRQMNWCRCVFDGWLDGCVCWSEEGG